MCHEGHRPGGRPLTPANLTFVLIAFEGPDAYARAGGLGVRVAELSQALAEAGCTVHVVYVGDPALPGDETGIDGRLRLHRWCQWISTHHPGGVYDGEEGKWRDFTDTVPAFVVDDIVRPALDAGQQVVVLGEEWHTAETLCCISDRLWWAGLRDRAVLLWNANNTMGFERLDWGRLRVATTITTVSRYMKHLMWSYGVDPLVIPNGIPRRWVEAPPDANAAALRRTLGSGAVLVKVARWDPDKRWLLALETLAQLKRTDHQAKLVARGGAEAHGGDVMGHARSLGLRVHHVAVPDTQSDTLVEAFAGSHAADVVNVTTPLAPDSLRVLYRAADCVLANSGREPFGLVGLEAMASGGAVYTGNTGEEYARHLENAVVLDTADPAEAAWYVNYMQLHPGEQDRLRCGGRETARAFVWERVLEQLLARVLMLAARQHN